MRNDDPGKRDENTKPSMTRRLLVARGAAVAGIGAALTGPAEAQRSGLTDNDPNDGPGRGRGGYRGTGYRTGITDSDPNDGPGRGRGGYRGGGYRTGVTDSDPNDGPGRGRRGY